MANRQTKFNFSSSWTTKCLQVPDGLGPFDKPFLPPLLNSSCKNCARLQNFPKHYNFARHSAAAGSENRRPGCDIRLPGDFQCFAATSDKNSSSRLEVKKRPPLLFFGLSLSLSFISPGCDMAVRRGVALTTPQPHTTVPEQPRKIIGRQVVVLPWPPWFPAQLRREISLKGTLHSVTSQFFHPKQRTRKGTSSNGRASYSPIRRGTYYFPLPLTHQSSKYCLPSVRVRVRAVGLPLFPRRCHRRRFLSFRTKTH